MDRIKATNHLLEFSVANYRSIREKVTLSLVSRSKNSPGVEFASDNTKQRLLKSVIIYGPNASGKSNVLRALFLMRLAIIGGNQLFSERNSSSDTLEPFLLDHKSREEDSFFDVKFEYNGRTYIYGFTANASSEKITSEWLKYMDGGRPRFTLVFRRTNNTVKINDNIPVSEHGISRSYRKQVAEKELFVTTLSRVANRTLAHEVVGAWQNSNVLNTLVHDTLEPSMNMLYKEPRLKERLLPLLAAADLAISDIRIDVDKSTSKLIVHLEHTVKTKNGRKKVLFNIDDQESAGTLKFLSFAIPLLESLENGTLMVLDELGSSLHPSLLRYVVKLFHSKAHNPNDAQLILTAHDTSLLKDLFDRDQIYFTEKTAEQATDLYSLSDIKNVRKDTPNFDTRYLRGDYGATPDILYEMD